MTCPYFSIDSGKIRCSAYGVIEDREKSKDCQGDYTTCLQKANEWLNRRVREQSTSSKPESVRGFQSERKDFVTVLSQGISSDPIRF
jgi:hypothetical protein